MPVVDLRRFQAEQAKPVPCSECGGEFWMLKRASDEMYLQCVNCDDMVDAKTLNYPGLFDL